MHVGQRLRFRRMLLGMGQGKLGDATGISFQQVQKYEHGSTRISASRLYDLARVLNMPVSYFFEEFGGSPRRGSMPIDANGLIHSNSMTNGETLKFVRAYLGISNPRLKHEVFELAKVLGDKFKAKQ